MGRARLKVSACVLAVGVLGAACSSGGDGDSATATTVPDYNAAEGLASPAADLRSDLTAVLQEHVLLTGITSAALVAGQDSAPAAAVLDQNSVALADVFTTLYGAPIGSQFLDLWRKHTAVLLEFAAASAVPDEARIDKAKADLTAIQAEIATVVSTANPQITVDKLTEELDGYTSVLQTALTAQAEKEPTAAVRLKEASDHMAATAIVLAAGIVKHAPDAFPGAVDGIGAAMRAELTSKLQEHTYLAGIATGDVLAGGDLEPPAEALEENSLELARAFGTVYGDDAQRRFLELWRQHISFFVDFTGAAAAGDQAGMSEARQALDGYRTAFATFLNEINPNLSRQEVEEDFGVHVDSLLAAIQAQAAGEPGRVVKLREAAGHMTDTALYLATGIARQYPIKFG